MEFYGREQADYCHKMGKQNCSICFNSWKEFSLDLVKRSPKTKAEFCRQPLIWNPICTDYTDHMHGRHTICTWVELDQGPRQCIGDERAFLSSSANQRTLVLAKIMGGMGMFSTTIQAIFYSVHMHFGSLHISG